MPNFFKRGDTSLEGGGGGGAGSFAMARTGNISVPSHTYTDIIGYTIAPAIFGTGLEIFSDGIRVLTAGPYVVKFGIFAPTYLPSSLGSYMMQNYLSWVDAAGNVAPETYGESVTIPAETPESVGGHYYEMTKAFNAPEGVWFRPRLRQFTGSTVSGVQARLIVHSV